MLDQTRLNYLFQRFVVAKQMNDEEIDQLSLEEMSYIYAAAEVGKKDPKFKDNNLPIRQQIFYWRVVKLLKEADGLYIAYPSGMNYPYQDLGRNAWIFSTEEIARRVADDVKAKRKISLQVRRVDKSMIQPLFIQLYYCGVEGVLLDQGAHPMPVKRSDLFDMPPEGDNPGQRQVSNGKLQSALVQFFQAVRNPEMENRAKLLPALETNLLVQLMNATFLIPMQLVKNGQPIKPGIQVSETEGIERRIANLRDSKEMTDWLPVFTDWPEFGRTFKTTEWGAAVVNYSGMMKISRDLSKNIVINPKGCAFRINEQVKEQLDRFAPRKEEIERAMTDKEAAKALTEKLKKEAEQKRAQSAAAAGETSDAADLAGRVESLAGLERSDADIAAGKGNEAGTGAQADNSAAGSDGALEPAEYRPTEDFPDLLASVLKKTAKASKIVRRMWLLDRVAQNSSGYLLVIESDYETDELEEDLQDVAEEYLDGSVLEIRNLDDETEELVEELKPFYKKGLFG